MKKIKLNKLEQTFNKCLSNVKSLVEKVKKLIKEKSLITEYYEYKEYKEKLEKNQILDLTVIDDYTANYIFGIEKWKLDERGLGDYISRWITAIQRRRNLPVFKNYQWNYDSDGKHLKIESLNWSTEEDLKVLNECLFNDYGGSDYTDQLAINKEK